MKQNLSPRWPNGKAVREFIARYLGWLLGGGTVERRGVVAIASLGWCLDYNNSGFNSHPWSIFYEKRQLHNG